MTTPHHAGEGKEGAFKCLICPVCGAYEVVCPHPKLWDTPIHPKRAEAEGWVRPASKPEDGVEALIEVQRKGVLSVEKVKELRRVYECKGSLPKTGGGRELFNMAIWAAEILNTTPAPQGSTAPRKCRECGREGKPGDWSECFTVCDVCWPVEAPQGSKEEKP